MVVLFNPNDNKLVSKLVSISEGAFHTQVDDTQIPASQETQDKFLPLDPHCLAVDVTDEGEPRGFVLIIPTQKTLAEGFLKDKITERNLLWETVRSDKYDALYICAAVTNPKYRRQGVAMNLLSVTVDKFLSRYPIDLIVAWPYSDEGMKLGKALEVKIGRTIVFKA